MSAKSKRKPSPEDLLAEVRGIESAKTYEFEEYLEVVHELQQKDYSYAKIAEFLKERLGIEVSRGQVYRAYQMWLEERSAVEEQEFADAQPPDDFQDRFDRELEERAKQLIEEMQEQEAHSGGEPWNDAELILGRAHAILKAQREERERAEHEAEAADRRLEEKKATDNGPKK